VLGNVLVDGVVGKAGELVNDFIHVNFGFGDAAGFGNAQNTIGNGTQFPFRPKRNFGGGGAAPGD
jgi:hypothetical protein